MSDVPGEHVPQVLLQEQSARWQRGERVLVEDYLALHPGLRDNSEVVLDLITNEVLLRQQAGETPHLDEYLGRFPDLAEPLRVQFEVEQAIHEGDSLHGDVAAAAPLVGSGPSGGAEAPPPPAVPGYQILGELGRGSMGVVYKARHWRLNRVVALKMILSGGRAGPEERLRFLAEAEAVAAIKHPGIVHVHDFGTHEGLPFLSLEFCEGGSLADRLRGAPLPGREAARLVGQLAHAVQAAHDHGIVHRDLKPGNVLLTADGTPKVSDFGLAKRVAAGPGMTATGAVLGTPSYMAPEQVDGSRGVGPAADVYALGAILYDCLTGKPPFRAAAVLDTLLQVRNEEPVPPRQINPAVPRDLETICLKALAKEPHRRYPSARALVEDLGRYLTHTPVQARRVGAAGRLALWCRRRPALAGTLAAAGLAVLTVALLGYAGVARERDRYRAERDRAQANLFRALVGEAGAQMQARNTGWWWQAQENLRQAARLDVPERDPETLRELAVECLGSPYLCFRLHATWAGHGGPVLALAVQPGGRLAASGSRDRTVRLWSVPDGKPLGVLAGYTGAVTGVAFHPNGHRLASGAEDGTVRLWDLGPPADPLAGAADACVFDLRAPVRAVEFAPDGRHLVAACQDGTVRLLPLSGPAAARTLHGHAGAVTCLAFAPGRQTFASGGADRTIRFWDLASGKQTAVWPVAHAVTALTFRPLPAADGPARPRTRPSDLDESLAWGDGDTARLYWRDLGGNQSSTRAHAEFVSRICYDGEHRLLSASGDGSLKAWIDGKEVAVARGTWGSARAVALEPGSGWVAAGYDDGQVRLWQLSEPPPRWFSPHLAAGHGAAFLGRQRLLAMANPVGTGLWDFTASLGAPPQYFGVPAVRALAVHPAGRLLAFGREGGTLHLWDLAAGREGLAWAGHVGRVTALAGSPDGRFLASAAADGRVKLWDWETGRPAGVLEPGVGPLHALAWGAGGRLATAGERGAAVWEAADGPPAGRPALAFAHALPTSAVALGADTLALSGADGAVELRDARSGRLLRTLRGHTAAVAALEFSPDGRTLASGALDGAVRLWDRATGRAGRVFQQSASEITLLTFDPRGRYLFAHVPLREQRALIWDLRSGDHVADLHLTGSACGCARFTADGSALLLGTSAGSVLRCPVAEVERAWAAARGSGAAATPSGAVRIDVPTTVVPGGHALSVWGFAASPDGRWLATGSHDRTVKLWDVRARALVHTLTGHADTVWCVAFSPDGKYLASGCDRQVGPGGKERGEVKVWEVAGGRQVHHFEGGEDMVTSLAFHPRHPWLASANLDGSVWLWDVARGRPLGLLHRFGQRVNGVAFSPDGRRLVAACHNGRVAVWELGAAPSLPAAPTRTLTGHTGSVWSVGFSPDGRYLASGAAQGVIILWDGATLERVVRLRGGPGQIRCVCFSADGQLLAGTAWDSPVMAPAVVWDLAHLRRSLDELGLDWPAR